MTTLEFFKIIVEDIHSTIVAVADKNNLPVTCAVDIMDYDENGLYFLTARGKNFYGRLKDKQYLSFTGIKGSDTLHSVSATVCGHVREIGRQRLNRLLRNNPYIAQIYPDEKSREALTVFQIYKGTGELFDLSKKPIERCNFSFGNALLSECGYYITSKCEKCRACLTVCPQKCIDISGETAEINQENCLHCGNCLEICRFGAVRKRG